MQITLKPGTVIEVDKSLQPLTMRKFETGATRNIDLNKFDYEGFLSPLVLQKFGQYMHSHRKQADGQLRDSDNWQKGIPKEAYIKSGWRHFFDWWKEHRGYKTMDGLEGAICALMFNAMGYLHEHLKEKQIGTRGDCEGGPRSESGVLPVPGGLQPDVLGVRATMAEGLSTCGCETSHR